MKSIVDTDKIKAEAFDAIKEVSETYSQEPLRQLLTIQNIINDRNDFINEILSIGEMKQ